MSIDPITATKIWLLVRPIRRLRNRRRAKRGLPPLTDEEAMKGETNTWTNDATGEKVTRTEPIIKANTSTKMFGVGATVFAATAAAIVPNWDAINVAVKAACESEHGPTIGLGMMAAMLGVNYVTARLTKTPLKPGKA
jgi:hypothetical protein